MNTLFNSAKSILLLLAFSFALIGCSNETVLDLQEDTLNKSLSSDNSELSLRQGTQLHFKTNLSAKKAVPPNASKATGQVIVTISKDETKIHFKLITANIIDVGAAHFHLAPPGTNGGVVVPLFGGPPAGPANGILAEGYITAGNVVGALAGDLDALIAAIRDGNIYVNVHTVAIGAGEMRGWLK